MFAGLLAGGIATAGWTGVLLLHGEDCRFVAREQQQSKVCRITHAETNAAATTRGRARRSTKTPFTCCADGNDDGAAAATLASDR